MTHDLNVEQRKAADALTGPVRVSAGAGSGKTKTLSVRFAHALECDENEGWEPADPKQVLTITFTDKAAGELAERIRTTLRDAGKRAAAREVDRAWISTIHGFCSRILRRYALEAGLDPAFSVADTVEAGRLAEQAFGAAARVVLGTDDGAALFRDVEFSEVWRGVESVAAALRTRGLEAGALRIEESRPAADVLRDALKLVEPVGRAIAACADPGVNMARLCDRCEAAARALAQIEPDARSDADVNLAVWRALVEVKPCAPTKRTGDVVVAFSAGLAPLVADAATGAAAPYARAMKALAERHLAEYAALKRERGVLDFDDLQAETLRLFGSRADVLEECRSLFRLVMVDEFQDTDALQLALVRAVAGENLCTVGDEHQSIYGFRGADIDVFRAHEEQMRVAGARSAELSENYRSHAAVLDFVNEVFGHPGLFGEKLLSLRHGRTEADQTRLPEGEPRLDLAFVHSEGKAAGPARSAEARLVAERFAALRDHHGFNGGEMVVLVRSYAHADVYAEALRAKGFEVVVIGGSRFFALPEIRTMRALVRAIANPHDEASLMTLLASDMGRLSDDGLLCLRSRSAGSNGGLWKALEAPDDGLDDDDARREEMVRMALTRAHERLGRLGLSEVILRATEECGFDLVLLSRGDQGEQAYANVLKFARLATEFESSSSGAGAASFAAHLDAKEQFGEHVPPATLSDEHSGAVRIVSIHSSKGLEFPVVAVVGLESGAPGGSEIVRVRPDADPGRIALSVKLPFAASQGDGRPWLFRRLDDEAKLASIEEGKRLFYVACTRAREALVLSGFANFLNEPGKTESPLRWLRLALPRLDAPIDGGPVARSLGQWPLRIEIASPSGEDARHSGAGSAAEPEARPCEPVAPVHEAPVPTPSSPAPKRLSYTDLALYAECPKRFWAQRVVKIGRVSLPLPGDPRRLGSAVHAALHVGAGKMPSPDRLEALGRHFELAEADMGEVHAAVASFIASPTARALEACDVVRREWDFVLGVGEPGDDVTLVGSLDAYGRTARHGLVVDYKSGTSDEGEGLEERYRLQAGCYALVALRDGCEHVRVVFSRLQVLDQDGSPHEVEFVFEAADAARLADQVLEAHRRMIADGYPELAAWDARICDGCPIRGTLCAVRGPKGA